MNRALLVGINEYPDPNKLNGCVNDATDMQAFLQGICGFAPAAIRLLADSDATTKAILDGLAWLIAGVGAGDRLLLHYSGHGAQMPTRNPQQEIDGLDEVICPVDFNWSDEHAIRDKQFFQMFTSLPQGLEFVWVSDSCHSGDLYRLVAHAKIAYQRPKTIQPPSEIRIQIEKAREKHVPQMTLRAAADVNHVALLAACGEAETAADTSFNGRYNGAFTYFLLQELRGAAGMTSPLDPLSASVSSDLQKSGYTQRPGNDGDRAIRARPFLKLT